MAARRPSLARHRPRRRPPPSASPDRKRFSRPLRPRSASDGASARRLCLPPWRPARQAQRIPRRTRTPGRSRHRPAAPRGRSTACAPSSACRFRVSTRKASTVARLKAWWAAERKVRQTAQRMTPRVARRAAARVAMQKTLQAARRAAALTALHPFPQPELGRPGSPPGSASGASSFAAWRCAAWACPVPPPGRRPASPHSRRRRSTPPQPPRDAPRDGRPPCP